MKTQLHHVGLSVGNPDATVDALCAAFGAVRIPNASAGHVFVRIGDLQLALVPRTDGDPPRRAWGDHLALTVPAGSLHDAVRRLGERGWNTQEVHGRIYVQNGDASLTLELLVG